MDNYAEILGQRVMSGMMTLDEIELSVTKEVFDGVKEYIKKRKIKENQQPIPAESLADIGKLYSIKELADLLPVKASTINAYIHSNDDFVAKDVTYIEGRGAHGKWLRVTHERLLFMQSID